MGTISLCAVGRNEAENLKGLLDSVKPLVDEIVYVDTGSRDESIKIAEEFGCRVFRYEQKEGEWIESARNLGLREAKSEWILVLDMDERISASDFEKIRKLTENKEYAGYYLVQRHYVNDTGIAGWKSSLGDRYEESKSASGWHESQILRLFINDNRIKYEGKPHDLVDWSVKSIGKTCLTDIPIHHFGELNRDKKGKISRNLEFLRQHLNDENNREKFFTYFQIASELISSGNIKEAKENLEKAIELKPDFFNAIVNLAAVYLREKNLDEAEKLFIRALNLKQTSELYNNLGILYSEKKEFNRAVKKFERAIELNEKSADANFNLGLTYMRMGKESKARPYFEKAVELNPEYKKRIILS